jgi:hypothetical protein
MTTLTRRQTLIGAAATVAAAALPAAAAVSDDYVMTPAMAKLLADMGAPWTGITWDGMPPNRQCAVWWEDRLHGLLWKRVNDRWACLGPIVDPVYTMIDDGGAPGLETYVQAVPAWHLDYALAEDETDTLED